jgi:hypothetical protein
VQVREVAKSKKCLRNRRGDGLWRVAQRSQWQRGVEVDGGGALDRGLEFGDGGPSLIFGVAGAYGSWLGLAWR